VAERIDVRVINLTNENRDALPALLAREIEVSK
jgi:hypothetical protein